MVRNQTVLSGGSTRPSSGSTAPASCQLFALAARVESTPGTVQPNRARPRALLPVITAPVLARGRLTGAFER